MYGWFPMSNHNPSILNWNVRGLNCPNRRATIRETIAATPCHIICIQESKMADIDQFVVSSLGGLRHGSFAHRPASGTRGGILILWDDDVVKLANIHFGQFTLSADVQLANSDVMFKLTTVYGPTRSNLKDIFFQELISEKPNAGDRKSVV